jgi:hypothetical protein
MKSIINFCRRHGKQIVTGVILVTIVITVYLVIDYRGPREISLRPDRAFGMECMRARDLIVQEYDGEGNLWASRGMIVYKQVRGEDKFTRIAHVPTGFSLFWLRNFTLLRRFTVRPECIEMVTGPDGEICALSAGKIWFCPGGEKKFEMAMELAHYGFGDQGIRNDGIIRTDDSTLFIGEYFQNEERTRVRIFESHNLGRSWRTAYTFQPGEIRHIHALQKDPYTGKLWICTGDKNEESMIAWSEDNFKTIVPAGKGSQLWRACQLVFTEDAIFWGSDNSSAEMAGIYRLDKDTQELSKLTEVDGAVFFGTRLAQGTIVMSTDREGWDIEKDTHTRLWITMDDKFVKSIVGGTWKHNKPGFKFKFAQLRFQRNQGSPSLAISCLNQKEFPDGDLLIIPEETLLKALSD